MPCRRKWQPIPVFLSGESQGRGSLVGCRLWGRTESDTAEATQQQQQWIRAADWSLPCPLSPLVTRSLHLVSVSLFMYIHLFYFLDPTYKWYHMVFAFLWLISASTIISSLIHVVANGIIHSLWWLSNILLCVCIYMCIYIYTAAVAKLLQSCPTLCDPIDGSPPGSSIPGILQTRTLEWVAISFSNTCMLSRSSHVRLCVTPWTAAHQAPLSTEFSRQEY